MSDVTIKTPEEIEKLREGGRILALILKKICQAVQIGVKTQELDDLARRLIKEYQVEASFLEFGEPPYPAVICTSINEEVVHCIPRDKAIKEGDIIGLDIGIWHKGLCTDMSRTVMVGNVSKEAKKLVKVTKIALEVAKRQIKDGNRTGDLGYAVQKYVEENGFSVVKKLVGHGVGYKVHEPPQIPNYGTKGQGEIFKEGMVIAIEPMVNIGGSDIKVLDSGWDIITKDHSLSAHFEDTVVVTKHGCETLTK